MNYISSRDNKFVKLYLKLATSKSERKNSNLFVIEGHKLVNEAISSNIKIEMVFVTEAFLQKYQDKKMPLLEKLFQSEECYIVSEAVEKKMAEAKSPQGIYAICTVKQNTMTLTDFKQNGNYIMLVDLQDVGNVGTILRSAEAIGIDGVILTSSTCDILSPKLIRASMGSVFRINTLIVDDTLEFLKEAKLNQICTYASVIDANANDVRLEKFASPVILLIGNEGNGLSDAVANMCDKKITIKMKGNAESLNAAMASCILMWEIVNKQ